MSLMPRKRPEGLIDGCFGNAQYCARCDHEIEFSFDRDSHLCKSCKALRVLEETEKPEQTD